MTMSIETILKTAKDTSQAISRIQGLKPTAEGEACYQASLTLIDTLSELMLQSELSRQPERLVEEKKQSDLSPRFK